MTPKTTLRAALADKALLGHELQGDSFASWRALLIGAMGEQLTEAERVAFKQLTGRPQEPNHRVEELVVVAGRRAGKSLCAALLACYQATLIEHVALRRGEHARVLCISPDIRQSRVVRNYAQGLLEASPVLAPMVENSTADSITLSNRVTIECRAASFRRLRGVTCVAVIADETCFWQSDETSSNPDTEILNAVRPTLATTQGLMTIISTPYSRKGETWRLFNEHHGADGDPNILVAQGASRDLNPTLPEKVVARALERDPAAAAAEYLGEWRNDIASFLDRRIIETVVERDCFERPRESGVTYVGFCDPSGGSSDSFTLAIAHRTTDDKIILDALRETRPPFSPAEVVHDYAKLLSLYGVTTVHGDRYSGEFCRELFRKRSINYKPSERTKSDLFIELLPAINSRRVQLLDNERLVSQFCGLERRTGFSGKDSVGHPQGQGSHDDVANACAGALWVAQFASRREVYVGTYIGGY